MFIENMNPWDLRPMISHQKNTATQIIDIKVKPIPLQFTNHLN